MSECIFWSVVIFFIGIIWIYLTYFIFGFFPFIKAKNLREDDILKIRQLGISHKTTSEGKAGIENDGKIKGSKFRKAYSNHFKRTAFFFANAYIKDGEDINNNLKYEYTIKISNLSERQIQNFKIREYDKALMYNGDFTIEEQNIIQIEPIEREKYKVIDFIKFFVKSLCPTKMDKYMKGLLLSLSISGLLFILMIFFCVVCFFNKIFGIY